MVPEGIFAAAKTPLPMCTCQCLEIAEFEQSCPWVYFEPVSVLEIVATLFDLYDRLIPWPLVKSVRRGRQSVCW